MALTKKDQRIRRSRQTRVRIATQRVARLTVFRTNLHIYASVISDDGAKVLASASTAEAEIRKELGAAGKGGNVNAANIRPNPNGEVRRVAGRPNGNGGRPGAGDANPGPKPKPGAGNANLPRDRPNPGRRPNGEGRRTGGD